MDFDVPILADDEPPDQPRSRAEVRPDASRTASDRTQAESVAQPPHVQREVKPHSSRSLGGDPAAFVESLLVDLTSPQREAVLHTEGPLLVLAAAGSGKTRVITRRIAYLISCGVVPWQILALTFTNKAAGEMRERIHAILGSDQDSRATKGLTVTTFHALCARLLRRYAEAAGLKPDFTIYDTADQLSLIKSAIAAAQLSTANFQPRSVLSAISNAKNDLIDAEAFAKEAFDFSSKCIAAVYKGYVKSLRQANAVDFDDLLMLVARLLQHDPVVRAECQKRWQYLLIDEYQDTNQAQFLIASLIAGEPAGVKGEGAGASGGSGGGKGPNICVVGDPDQAIYGWRGADISNILEFEAHYPAASVIKLGENFRSTESILTCADTLIKFNKQRKHKPLFTSKPGGDKVEANLCRDERHEASVVARWLKERHDSGTAWREMAIFYRTNALSRVMEEALREKSVPYTIARGTSFYDREEVKNAIGYLRVVANQADSVSLGRIVNVPARGIGDTSYEKAEHISQRTGLPVLEVLRRADSIPELSSRAVNSIKKFVTMLDDWTGGGTFMGEKVGSTLAELVNRVIQESGLEGMYKAQAASTKNETDAERLDNLAELVSSAAEFEKEYDPTADASLDGGAASIPPLLALLRAYLESIALVADADAVDPSQGSVTLMTLHAAKGLEFGAVAMIGLEEGILPHMRSRESEAALEEERRLCFVGITRAMRRLLMTCSKYRTQRGMSERTIPSRFFDELPREHIVITDQSDVGSGLEGTAWDDESQDQGDHDDFGSSSSAQTKPRSGGSSLGAEFPAGCTVRHPQFGVGVVQSATGGAQPRVTVNFKGIGSKTLVLEYARLTKVR